MTIRRSLVLALALSLFSLPPAQAQDKAPVQKIEVKKGQIEIEVQSLDFRDFCEMIGKKLKINILVSPGIEETISLRLGTKKQSILFKVLEGITQCQLEKVAKNVYIFSRPPKSRIQVEGTSLHELLITLAKSSEKNLVIGPGVPNTPIESLKANHFYTVELMTRLTLAGGCRLEQDGDVLRIFRNRGPIRLGTTQSSSFIRPLIQPSGAEEKKPKSPPKKLKNIELDVLEIEAAALFAQLGKKTGWTFVVNPQVKRKISISLRDIPPTDALRIILKLTDCKLREYQGRFHIDPDEKVSLTKRNIELKELIKILAERMNRKIEIPADLRGKVSVYFKEFPAERALVSLVSAVTEKSILDEFGKALRLVDKAKTQNKKTSPKVQQAVKKASFEKLKAALQKKDRRQIDKLFLSESLARRTEYPKIIADFAKALPDSESDLQRSLLAQSKRLLGDVLQNQANEAYKALDFRRVVIQQQKLKREIALLKIKDRQEHRLVHHSLIQNLRYVDKLVEQLRPLKKLKLRFQGGLFNALRYSPRLKNFALISGRYYFEKEVIRNSKGQEIEGLKVYSIEDSKVTLQFKDQRFILKLSSSR